MMKLLLRAFTFLVCSAAISSVGMAQATDPALKDPLQTEARAILVEPTGVPDFRRAGDWLLPAAGSAEPAPAPAFFSASGGFPRAEWFLGYSYVRARPGLGISPFNEHGGSGSIALNANRHLGFVADVGAYHIGRIEGQLVHGTLLSYLFGPRLSLRNRSRVTPFFQALFGGARLTGTFAFPSDSISGFAMTGGGGLDITLGPHVAWRAVQAEYLLTRFQFVFFERQNQNNARISTGIVFRFGGGQAVPVNHVPVVACSAEKSSIRGGETDQPVAIHAMASDPDGDPLSFTWTATGGSVEGTGPQVRWHPGSASAGLYTITVRVDDGRGGTASCAADVRVEP